MHKKINNSLTKNFIQGFNLLANTLPQQIKNFEKNGSIYLRLLIIGLKLLVRKSQINAIH